MAIFQELMEFEEKWRNLENPLSLALRKQRSQV
jgi:hypothetical protein